MNQSPASQMNSKDNLNIQSKLSLNTADKKKVEKIRTDICYDILRSMYVRYTKELSCRIYLDDDKLYTQTDCDIKMIYSLSEDFVNTINEKLPTATSGPIGNDTTKPIDNTLMCNLICHFYEHDIMIGTNPESDFYIFDYTTKLYTPKCKQEFNTWCGEKATLIRDCWNYYKTDQTETVINTSDLSFDEVTYKMKKWKNKSFKWTNCLVNQRELREHIIGQLRCPGSEKLLNLSDPDSLPIKHGKIISLETGIVRCRTPSDLFSFECQVEIPDIEDIEATDEYKTVVSWFSDIFLNDMALMSYVMECLGYMMTGRTEERCFFIAWGTGANGKGAITNILKAILGSYYAAVDKGVIIGNDDNKRSKGQHTSHLAPLIGSRFACFAETCKTDRLNESLLKTLTGNDVIYHRDAYQRGAGEPFQSQSKIFLQTNHKPHFECGDNAMKDRLKYIPFNARFVWNPTAPNEKLRNPRLVNKVEKELIDYAFYFLIHQGTMKWYSNFNNEIPLTPPSIVKKAQEDYLGEIDSVQQFVNETLVKSDNKQDAIPLSVVRRIYKQWCEENSKQPTDDFIGSMNSRLGVECKQNRYEYEGRKFKTKSWNGWYVVKMDS